MFSRELSFKTCAQEYHRCTAELAFIMADVCLRQLTGSWPRDVCRRSALCGRTGLLYATLLHARRWCEMRCIFLKRQ